MLYNPTLSLEKILEKAKSPLLNPKLRLTALIGTVFIVGLWTIVSFPFLLAPLGMLIMSPLSIVIVGPLIGLFLAPPYLTWLSYKTKRYITSIILAILSITGMLLYGGFLIDPLLGRLGLSPEKRPSNILLPQESSIPARFHWSEPQTLDAKYYIKTYKDRSLLPLRDSEFIRIWYTFGESCSEVLNGATVQSVRCGDMSCMRLGGKGWKGAYEVESASYYIDDRGSCLGIEFTDINKLTQKEIYKILDTLERTP